MNSEFHFMKFLITNQNESIFCCCCYLQGLYNRRVKTARYRRFYCRRFSQQVVNFRQRFGHLCTWKLQTLGILNFKRSARYLVRNSAFSPTKAKKESIFLFSLFAIKDLCLTDPAVEASLVDSNFLFTFKNTSADSDEQQPPSKTLVACTGNQQTARIFFVKSQR